MMSADSNMNFHHDVFPSSFFNNHVVSFQSGAVNSTSMVVPLGMNNSTMMSSTSGIILPGNSLGMISSTSSMLPARNSPGNVLPEPIPSLKHDTGIAVDWSFEEQAILKAGLIKFTDQPTIMKYIKIAAMLPDKTARDVALRCRWMTKKESGKRRKPGDYFAGKKIKDRKEKTAESSSNATIHPVIADNMAAYPFMLHHLNQQDTFSQHVPVVDNATRGLLNENAQVLNKITANLATFKLQDNIDLFFRARNNIMAILHSTDGSSHMPPLPVSLSDELMNTVLEDISQVHMFGTSGAAHLKQEPGC